MSFHDWAYILELPDFWNFSTVCYFTSSKSKQCVLCVHPEVKHVGRNRVVFSYALTARRRKLQRKSKHSFYLNNGFFFENHTVCEIVWTIQWSLTGHRWKYGACVWHDGYLRLQRHTRIMYKSLLFHCYSGYTNALQWYIIRTWPVLFTFITSITDTETEASIAVIC